METTSTRDFPFGWHRAELATIHSTFERSANRLGDPFVCTAFHAIHVRVGNHAAGIYNLRSERPIANAVFRWLAHCAGRAGDQNALTLHRNNAGMGS